MNRIFHAIAVSAIAASISFAADAQSVIGQMTPFRTYPAIGAEIPSFQGISTVSFIFPGGGDIGMEAINRAGRAVTITRSGETICTIDCTDRAAVYNPANNPSELTIAFPKITTPGTYTVTIPQNLVTMAIDYNVAGANETEDEESEDSLAARISKEYSMEFEIVACPEFTIDPAPGKLYPEQLHTVTLTFPEGTTVYPMPEMDLPVTFEADATDEEPGDDNGDDEEEEVPPTPIVVGLYDYNDASYETGHASSLITEYNVEYKGNKVVLTAQNPSAIQPRRGNYYVNWDYVNIPKDSWFMVLDGEEYQMPAFKFEKYDVLDPVLMQFEITPQNGLDRDMAPSEFETITIKYPETFSPSASSKAGANLGFLRQCGVSPEMAAATSGYVFGFYVIDNIDTRTRTITARLKPIAESNSYCNNLEAMETGYYSFYLNGSIFNTPNGTNSAIDFPGYFVNGKETTEPNCITPENIAVKPNIVDPNQGFSYATLEWPFPMAVENNAAAITLTFDDAAVGTVPVTSLEINNKGVRTMRLQFTNDIYLTPGTYTLHIPAGTFRQMNYGSYLNAEVSYDILLPGPMKYESVPAGGEKMSTATLVDEFSTIELCYDNITEVFVFEDEIDLSKISLELLNTSGIKTLEFHPTAISGEGNKVTLTFDPEIRIASGTKNYVYRLSVPAGIWIAIRFDEPSYNTDARFFYRIADPVAGTINRDPQYDLNLDDEIPLIPPYAGFVFTSPVQKIANTHTFGENAYVALVTDSGLQKYMDYTVVEQLDDYNILFDTNIDYLPGTRATESTTYRIVIPENSVIDYDYCGIYHPEYTYDIVINTTTGTNDILADSIGRDVYSIDGMLVAKKADKTVLSNLPKGIYIIGGKKFVK